MAKNREMGPVAQASQTVPDGAAAVAGLSGLSDVPPAPGDHASRPPSEMEARAAEFEAGVQKGRLMGLAEAAEVAMKNNPLVTRALTEPTKLAREYASAVAFICDTQQLMEPSRKNAVKLLRAALVLLENA